MAVSLSTNAVKLYSPLMGQYLGECKGHSSTINQISFAGPSASHVLYSCSSDSTLRAWDTRSFQQVSCINTGSSQEVFSFSFGGADGNLLAAGCNAQILLWDWRTMKQIACMEESHMEDVTQVVNTLLKNGNRDAIIFISVYKQNSLIMHRGLKNMNIKFLGCFGNLCPPPSSWKIHFIPGHQSKLLSASVDGLMCLFNASGDINDDDHLESVFNLGTSIGKVGFFGESNQKLWCLAHIETLSIWDWNDSRTESNFEDARTLASESWALDHVDYFVDCHYSPEDRLWVIGGTNAGTLGYFPVKYEATKTIGSAEAIFQGGPYRYHSECVANVKHTW